MKEGKHHRTSDGSFLLPVNKEAKEAPIQDLIAKTQKLLQIE